RDRRVNHDLVVGHYDLVVGAPSGGTIQLDALAGLVLNVHEVAGADQARCGRCGAASGNSRELNAATPSARCGQRGDVVVRDTSVGSSEPVVAARIRDVRDDVPVAVRRGAADQCDEVAPPV